MPVRTVVVRCPDWPVRSAMSAAGVDPEGADEIPAAVVFANQVVSTTPAARAEGVRRGLRRREAQSRCPRLVVLPPTRPGTRGRSSRWSRRSRSWRRGWR